jgi:hypothetical protein
MAESYEGVVPAAVGTGPKNLPKTGMIQAPIPPRISHIPDSPKVDMSLAGTGYSIPGGNDSSDNDADDQMGGGGGIARADSLLIKAPTVIPCGSSTGARPNDIPVKADIESVI